MLAENALSKNYSLGCPLERPPHCAFYACHCFISEVNFIGVGRGSNEKVFGPLNSGDGGRLGELLSCKDGLLLYEKEERFSVEPEVHRPGLRAVENAF